MTPEILLSICIPAYNQPKALSEVLDSIVIDFEDARVRDRVEIIIHDDASPFGSLAPVVSVYQEKYKNIRFVRHKENVGFDRNLLGAVNEALGKFCWLMSDNDALAEGALQKVVSFLDEYSDIGYAYVGARGYDGELKKELSGVAKSTEILCIESAEDFIRNYDLPGFVSSQIVRKELWDEVKKEKYVGNYWIHLSTILEFLPRASMLYIGIPLVKARGQSTWDKGGKGLTTFLFLHDIVNGLWQYGYSKKFIRGMNDGFARDLFGVMLYAKRRGLTFSARTAIQLCYKFYWYPTRLIFALLIFMIPQAIVDYFVKFKRYLCAY